MSTNRFKILLLELRTTNMWPPTVAKQTIKRLTYQIGKIHKLRTSTFHTRNNYDVIFTSHLLNNDILHERKH